MNLNKFRRLLIVVSLLILVSMAIVPVHAIVLIPLTGGANMGSSGPVATMLSLEQFIEQVRNGSAVQIAGLYIENLFSYPVIQQPGDQPAYVSSKADRVTQFRSASAFGSLGFLAHNYLAGIKFPEIKNGDLISVVYGDGRYVQYQVTQIRSFQALQPDDPYSSFVDLSNNKVLTFEEMFYQTYGVRKQLILQTCISSQGIDSWGRLLVIAIPYTPPTEKIVLPRIPATIQ